jgi:hypothetical protein
VAAVLVGMAVLELTVTHGVGAPKHPERAWAIIGLVTGLVTTATLRLRRRLLTAFAAVISAFFVSYPKVPNSLVLAKTVTLIAPLAFAFVMSQRERKATRAARGRTTAAERRAEVRSRGRQRSAATPSAKSRPTTGRYTPPKARRARR